MADKVVRATPLVYTDTDTGLRYIKGTENVLFDNGVKVRRADFDSRVVNRKTVAALVEEAAKRSENRGWDFNLALETRDLRRAKESAAIITSSNSAPPVQTAPRVVKAQSAKPATAEPPVARLHELARDVVTAKARSFFQAPHTDVMLILVVVALLCFTMSVYHTYNFLVLSGKTHVVAFAASLAMALYSSSAFTAARHVSSDRGIGTISRFFFSLFLVLTGCFVIVFSVFSTTNVSYDQYEARQKEKVEAIIEDSDELSVQDERIAEITQRIDEADAEIAKYSAQADQMYLVMNKPVPEVSIDEDTEARAVANKNRQRVLDERYIARRDHASIEAKIASAKDKREPLIEKLDATRNEKIEGTETVVASRKDAYDLVSSKIGMSKDTLSFVVYVIPSAFFDVVAPFAFAIVLMLNDRRSGKVLKRETGMVGNAAKVIANRLLNKIIGGKDVEGSR